MPQSPDINRMLVSIKGAETAIRPIVNASSQEARPQEREKFSRLWLQLKAKERKDGTSVVIDPSVVARRDSLWTQSQTDEDLLAEMKGLADLTLGTSKTREQELAQMQADYGDDFEPMLMNGLRARAEEALSSARRSSGTNPGRNPRTENVAEPEENGEPYVPSNETEKTVFFLSNAKREMSNAQWTVLVEEIRSRLSLSGSLMGLEDTLGTLGISLEDLDYEALYRTNPFDVDKYLRRMR